MCGLWSAGVAARLSAYPLVFLSSAAFNSLSSPVLRCCFRVFLHFVRSAARASQGAASMSSAFIETTVVIVRVIYITLINVYNSVLWFSASATALR